MKVTKDGLTVKGIVKADSGNLGTWTLDGNAIYNGS
jgi:hypothetical protein